jgi:hypothetical protein
VTEAGLTSRRRRKEGHNFWHMTGAACTWANPRPGYSVLGLERNGSMPYPLSHEVVRCLRCGKGRWPLRPTPTFGQEGNNSLPSPQRWKFKVQQTPADAANRVSMHELTSAQRSSRSPCRTSRTDTRLLNLGKSCRGASRRPHHAVDPLGRLPPWSTRLLQASHKVLPHG